MRGSLHALDRIALAYAERLSEQQPRCDLNIGQLPLLAAPLASDIVPVFHDGITWAALISDLGLSTSGLNAFNVLDYGADPTGTTDSTTAVNAALAAAAFAGGGNVYVPVGIFLCLGAIVFPYTLAGTDPISVPLRLFGVGPSRLGVATSAPAQASVLDLRYNGADGLNPGKISCIGRGSAEVDHITLISGGTDNFTILATTNSTLIAHDIAFHGNVANTGATCTQNAIQWGGKGYTAAGAASTMTSGSNIVTLAGAGFTLAQVGWEISIAGAGVAGALLRTTITGYTSPTQVTVTTNASTTVSAAQVTWGAYFTADPQGFFQGYGSRAFGNTFTRIQFCHYIGAGCNSLDIGPDVVAQDCGSPASDGAPIMFDPNTLDSCYNVRVWGGTFETVGYTYGVTMRNNTSACFIASPGSYDNLTLSALVHFATGTTVGNVVIAGALAAGVPIADGTGALSNVFISSASSLPSQFYNGVVVTGGSAAVVAPTVEATAFISPGGMTIKPGGGNPIQTQADFFIQTSAAVTVAKILASQSGTFVLGHGATGARPTASTVGVGAMWYDSTLSKPIFSDGTVWRDAEGTAV